MILSKLSSKAQTTVPRSVRAALGLKEGDAIAYEVRGHEVVITRAESSVVEDPFVLFDEWDSDEDRKAYAKL